MPQSRARRTVAQGLMTLLVRLICFVDTLGVGGQNYYCTAERDTKKNNVWMADCSLDSCAQ